MIKVIIVEDDPMVASINRKYIEKSGEMQVAGVFSDGQSALDHMEKDPADLVILDLYMSGISGLDVLRKIREKRYQTEVVMVTAANDNESIREIMNYGILDYLVKPFSYERFKQAMDTYKRKNDLLESSTSLAQSDIDKIVSLQQPAKKMPDVYEKGINKKTLEELICQLKAVKPAALTCEELAEKSGFSMVTVRRYMNYLVDCGIVEYGINYRTGGRPGINYKIK